MEAPNRSGSSALDLSCLGLDDDTLGELEILVGADRSSADAAASDSPTGSPGRAPSPTPQTLQVRSGGARIASGGGPANPQHVPGLVLLG
jgi:hypothetical protein